jgi:hypothetical protein
MGRSKKGYTRYVLQNIQLVLVLFMGANNCLHGIQSTTILQRLGKDIYLLEHNTS